MSEIIFRGGKQEYKVDGMGFLVDQEQWEEEFAEMMAKEVGILEGLTNTHWEVIRFIQGYFVRTAVCPMVYQTCKALDLDFKSLRRLFPSGYLRGACKLAGITYRSAFIGHQWFGVVTQRKPDIERVYGVDVFGFLVDPTDWDESFAIVRAQEMKIPGGLSPSHWRVIRFLRNYHEEQGDVPTIFETCESNEMELDELEALFPDGYHRGAVKAAGLRAI